MDPLLDFTNKVAVITGAAQGFGELLAKELASRGAKLVLGDVKVEDVQKVAADINAAGGKAIALKSDVAISADCKAMVDVAIQEFGGVDIGVNNAGVGHPMLPTHLMEEDIFDRQMAINVKGVQFGMQYQISQMLEQGSGVILNVSSMAGLEGAPRLPAYSAAKHAVIGLTKTAAVEYGHKNIRVNAVCPFFALTEMVTGIADDDMQAKMSLGTPMRRLAQPEEIVAMMLMMLSPANTYMNGQCIALDGGHSA